MLSVDGLQCTVTVVGVTASGTGVPGAVGGTLSPLPNTSNSFSEYPWVASARQRLVPYTRTYRPLPETPVRSSTPPSPVDVVKMGVQVAWSSEVSTRYATAQDRSQVSRTCVTLAVCPRST